MIGAWTRLGESEYRAVWDTFYDRFQFSPTGGRPVPAIRDPRPSITFDIRGVSESQADEIEVAARSAFLAAFGDEVELLVLDWQHDAYRLTPGLVAPVPLGEDGFPLIPTVVPDGDYYIYTTPDFVEGTFGHPWEPSLCVFGPKLTRSLGVELRAWLPVLRERAI